MADTNSRSKAQSGERDLATEEQLWQDPNWDCPRCHFTNLAIRNACRNCGYVGGEFAIECVAFLEIKDEAANVKWGKST